MGVTRQNKRAEVDIKVRGEREKCLCIRQGKASLSVRGSSECRVRRGGFQRG